MKTTMEALPKGVVARFWASVCKGPDCWIWTGYKRNGYGSLWLDGRNEYAHRLSFLIHFGAVRKGKEVLHSCDVPSCVRPEHLFKGTQIDNIADMRAKGRGKNPPVHTGERHHMVTLTDAQVRNMRRDHQKGLLTQRALASRYGVRQSTVWRIVHGVTRKAI